MGQTKHTIREILRRLEIIGRERPEDQGVMLDVMNIISHHIKLVDQLNKVSKPQPGQVQVIDSVEKVLYD